MKKTLLAILLLACLTLGLLVTTGCTAPRSSTGTDTADHGKSINVMITIEYPRKAKLAGMENIKFPVEENTTALQAIELFCSVSDIPCLLETTSNTIVGINTVRNGDFNKNKVWKFSINDGSIRTDASEVHLKNGDILKWTYELDEAAVAAEEAEKAEGEADGDKAESDKAGDKADGADDADDAGAEADDDKTNNAETDD